MAIAGWPPLAIGLAMSLIPAICVGQDLTPRAYLVTPVSSNAINLTYTYSTGELVFEPTAPVADAMGTIHAPVASVYHSFGVLGRSASITVALPFALGDLRGTVSGEGRAITRRGLADTVVRLAVNIAGGPALKVTEFVKTPAARSVLGASVKVLAPTGQYNPTRLINIGTNRWAFKPELGYTARAGNFVVDAFAGVWLFTANETFLVTENDPLGRRRTQDPVAAFELHLSYDVKPRLWISVDLNYWRGGRTSIDGVEGALTLLSNSRIGVTGSVPLTRHQSLKVSYSDGVLVRLGGDFRVLSAGWQYGWVGWGS
jgi:hypothetical protein